MSALSSLATATRRGYPAVYRQKPLEEQVGVLRTVWPALTPGTRILERERMALPAGAEALFAIPKWSKISSSPVGAAQDVMRKMVERRQLRTFFPITAHNEFRPHQLSSQRLDAFANGQEGDIVVVPAQFGALRSGVSGKAVRDSLAPNECALGFFAIGCMLLTHPKRIVCYDDLYIDCSGDDWILPNKEQFTYQPGLFFFENGLDLGISDLTSGGSIYGSPTALLPM